MRLFSWPGARASGADGRQGWAGLGFTTVSDGVVSHGHASERFVGQLMLTQDAGQAWRQVSF